MPTVRRGQQCEWDKSANANSANASSAMRHRCEKSATAVRMPTVRIAFFFLFYWLKNSTTEFFVFQKKHSLIYIYKTVVSVVCSHLSAVSRRCTPRSIDARATVRAYVNVRNESGRGAETAYAVCTDGSCIALKRLLFRQAPDGHETRRVSRLSVGSQKRKRWASVRGDHRARRARDQERASGKSPSMWACFFSLEVEVGVINPRKNLLFVEGTHGS